MALEKGRPGARKVRGGHYLVCQKKETKAVLAYKSKVVTRKSLCFLNFSPKSWCSIKKKGLHFQFISPFPNFSPKSWCFLKKSLQ